MVPIIRRSSSPGPVAPSASVLPNTTGPWKLGLASASQQVSIATHAVVAISGDGAAHTDTLNAALDASYVWGSGAHRHVDGILKDYRVGVGGAPMAALAGLQLARPFSAEGTANRSLTFTLPKEGSACTDPAFSVLQGLHDAWISLPDTLVPGREWSDTVQTFSCRDRVPLRGTAVRRFRVGRAEIESGLRVIVLIDRTIRGRLTGNGEQFGEQVALSGESSGTMHYAVDPTAGRLLRATGNATLNLSLKSSRRHQAVKQESSLVLTWIW